MNLSTPLKSLPGIGQYLSFKLSQLGLLTIFDLLTYYPFRYDDFSHLANVQEIKEGETVTLIGQIWSIKNIYTRSRKLITQAIFNDGSGPITLTWFNQPWLIKSILPGSHIQISGKVSKYKNNLSIIAPVWEKTTTVYGLQTTASKDTEDGRQKTVDNNIHTGRLVPVYSETEGITSKWLRTKIHQLIEQEIKIEDPIPQTFTKDLLPLNEAIKKIHFPADYNEAIKAKQRLAFDELFFLQLNSQKIKQEWQQKDVVEPLKIDTEQLKRFIETLPFELTVSQRKVIEEILDDLKGEKAMNRLVQGEVGSGKTVVAAVVMYMVLTNNLKALYMAPTEILAFQHHKTLSRFFEPFGISVGIYTGSKKFTKIQEETPNIIVGTHALLSEKLLPEDIGLVIIDEQQRFGVEQRGILRSKAKLPHFLTMTATPIPRTVALTLYGDLDVSVIDQLPKDRQKIKTYVVPNKKRADAYKFIAKQIKEGDQAYIITPLIEMSETMQSAKAAVVEFERLQKEVFPDLKLGLLHGRLKSAEKDAVLNDFKDGKVDILVSTSVVEVGVDVPNATIMVIESAERFGLAQLHQLRGRVGRGIKQSYCLLFSENSDANTTSRLKNLEKIDNGLKLAELDLKIRGSGQIFGTAQSGRLELKIADLSDLQLIEKARSAAKELLKEDPTLKDYPKLLEKLPSLQGNIKPD